MSEERYAARLIRSGRPTDDVVISPTNQRWLVWSRMAAEARPLTQEQVTDLTGIYAAQARVTELRQAGLIEPWDTVKNSRGNDVERFVLTPYGRREYVRLKTLWSTT